MACVAELDSAFRCDERALGTAEENAAFSVTGLFSWLCVCK